jgi:cytochrome P450
MTQAPYQEPVVTKCPVSLEDVDLFSPGAQEYWFDAYPILHREAPVHRLPGEGTTPDTDAFILTKYEDLARVVRDPARFPPPRYNRPPLVDPKTGQEIVFTPQMNAMGLSMMTLRPNMDLWKAHRQQLTDPWVGPTGAPRHTAMITKAVDDLMANWIDRGEVEFVGEFAAPLPQVVMTQVLGFPLEDMPKLREWGSAQVKRFVYGKGHRNLLTAEEEQEQVKVLGEFTDYVQEIVTFKREHPAEDMISWLCQVTYPALDRKLTDIEIIGIVYAMHLGGLETTQYALAEQAQILCRFPHLLDELRTDRSKIRFFVEEGMRLRAPTQGLSTRMTTQEEVFQGVKVPPGSILHMRWGAANLDPDEYEDPYTPRLDRPSAARHMTFSQGPRSCPGAGISRLEQNIAWQKLIDRIDSIRFAPGKNDFRHQPGIMLGLYELHLEFTTAK